MLFHHKINHIFFIVMILCLFLASRSNADTVKQGLGVLLNGTSSAGKSSVSRHVIKNLKAKTGITFQYESLDDFNTRKEEEEERLRETEANVQKDKKKDERSLIVADEDSDEDDEDDEEEDDDKEVVSSSASGSDDDSQSDFLEYVANLMKHGKNLVIDTVLRDEQDMADCNKILSKDVIRVLVYCPMREIPKRVEDRNKSGNRDEARTIYQALSQISDMFKISREPVEPVVDVFSKKDINNVLKPLEKELKEENKKKKKAGKREYDVKLTVQLVRKSLESRGRKSYITPKLHHHIIGINSKANGPEVCAKKISDHVVEHITKIDKKIKQRKSSLSKKTNLKCAFSLNEQHQFPIKNYMQFGIHTRVG